MDMSLEIVFTNLFYRIVFKVFRGDMAMIEVAAEREGQDRFLDNILKAFDVVIISKLALTKLVLIFTQMVDIVSQMIIVSKERIFWNFFSKIKNKE